MNLNNFDGRTAVSACPGDPAILTLPGLYVPEASGLCLHVNIRDESGTIVAQDVFDHSTISGENVDLTQLYSTLSPEIYQLEFILKCCDPQGVQCIYNDSNAYTKRVWIEIEGEFGFSASISQGGDFSPCSLSYPVSSAPLGPVYESAGPQCPLSLNIFNINNPNDEELSISIYELEDCDPSGSISLVGQANPTPPHNQSYNSLIPPFGSGPDCQCFRLDFEYENCGIKVVESYYFQVDGSSNECDNNLGGNGGSQFLESMKPGNMEGASVYPNPATGHIQIEIQAEEADLGSEWELSVFDNSGKLVKSSSVEILGSSSQVIPLKLAPGKYFYHLRQGNQSFNGSFIKH